MGGAGAAAAAREEAGPPAGTDERQLIDGIRWRTRAGAPWRDVPPCYGPWQTVYGLFRRWQRDGTWRKILTALQVRGRRGRADHLGCVRGLHRRAGPPARRRGAQTGDLQAEPPGGVQAEPADHGLGRSRGGLTTKVHLACEQRQKPLSVVITAGQRGDSPQFQPVLGRIAVPRPGPGRPRTAGPGPGRQGLRLPRQPRLPAQTRDPVHHPGEGRPGPLPQGQGPPRWPAACLRPRRTTRRATPWSAGSTG